MVAFGFLANEASVPIGVGRSWAQRVGAERGAGDGHLVCSYRLTNTPRTAWRANLSSRDEMPAGDGAVHPRFRIRLTLETQVDLILRPTLRAFSPNRESAEARCLTCTSKNTVALLALDVCHVLVPPEVLSLTNTVSIAPAIEAPPPIARVAI